MIDTSNVGGHLDVYTFQMLIDDALAMVPDTVDKRQGSIIYDTLAVGDVQLAQGYVRLKGYYLDCYALTAQGRYLDLRVAEMGVTRYPATAAVKRGVFADRQGNPVAVPLGAVFSSESDTDALQYIVTAVFEDDDGNAVSGSYRMTCETVGTAGNDYVGPLLPVTFQTGIATAAMDMLLIPARDEESDAALLARYLEWVNRPPFGGNVAHYRSWVLEMAGVGAVQVYPVWSGGGTVKVSIIGSNWLPASGALVGDVQTALDPEMNHAQGLGLAPIGHFVTVTTPAAVPIHIEANLTLYGSMGIGQVEQPIKDALSAYLLELRKQFGAASDINTYAINVYRARVAAAIMAVGGVENVTGVLLNGQDADLPLDQNAFSQELPVDGTVTLHAV